MQCCLSSNKGSLAGEGRSGWSLEPTIFYTLAGSQEGRKHLMFKYEHSLHCQQTLMGQNTFLPLSADSGAWQLFCTQWSFDQRKSARATAWASYGQVVCKRCNWQLSTTMWRPNVADDTNSVHCGRVSQAWSGPGLSSQVLW